MSRTLFRLLASATALVAWSALALQYVLLIGATWQDIGPLLGSLRFISFFTILSNVLVALTTTLALASKRSAIGDFFTSPRIRGGVALCIGITLCIYFFVLAAAWSPQGAQWFANIALHYLTPVLYLLWWAVCIPRGGLLWTDPLCWLAFPVAFFAWTLLRGAWLHEYPYPFVDVDTLGVVAVAGNALGIGVLFLFFGFLLVAFDRLARATG